MSETDTGNAIALPPRDIWIETPTGLTRWRPMVSSVTVEQLGGPDKLRLLTVRQDGVVLAQVRLTGAEAAHVAALLTREAGASAPEATA